MAVNASRPYIKIVGTGTLEDNQQTTIDGKTVMILSDPGAKLDRMNNGPILVVQSDNTDVSVYDLEITGHTGAVTEAAIQLQPNGGNPKLSLVHVKITQGQGLGILSVAGTLTVARSTISTNRGGGISVIGGAFVIVGNVFFNNGDDIQPIGGISISVGMNPMNRLEFNSFSLNKALMGNGAAVNCSAGSFMARNNIMSGNGGLMNSTQQSGSCAHSYSIVRPGTVPVGAGNMGGDPLFKDVVRGDLRVDVGSPAIRAADPSSDLGGLAARDIDGELRTSPADIGAYEAR